MAADVPGVKVPKPIVDRMNNAGDKEAQQKVGIEIALETLEKLKSTPGVDGVHIMAVHWEAIVPRLVEEADLPKPAITELPEPVIEA